MLRYLVISSLIAFFITSEASSLLGQLTPSTESNTAVREVHNWIFDEDVLPSFLHHEIGYEDLYDADQSYDQLTKEHQAYRRAIALLATHPRYGHGGLESFIKNYHPHPLTTKAKIALGRFYYNNREYEKGIAAYEGVNEQLLTIEELSDMHFRKGYCHFVNKQFGSALSSFEKTKDVRNKYYYPTNYYHAMCSFFQQDFDKAIIGFERVSSSKMYGSLVPSYLSQIYFAEGKYDQTISYLTHQLDNKEIGKKTQLHQLLGQSYYQKGQYQDALPHLQEYESKADKLTEAEFYQIGYTLLQEGQRADAIPYFESIALENSQWSQSANHYLAVIHRDLGDLQTSRNALLRVSKGKQDPALSEKALFNYAQMSAELGYDADAIKACLSLSESQTYQNSSKELLSVLLLESGDYDRSLSVLESLKPLNQELDNIYQYLHLSKGIKLLNENKPKEAFSFLREAAETGSNQENKAFALFNIGKVEHYKKNYQKSVQLLTSFFEISTDDHASRAEAEYLQGYNHYQLENYELAVPYLVASAKFMVSSSLYEKDMILEDAVLRSADAFFQMRKYPRALELYEQVSLMKEDQVDYALYQKGLVHDLMGQPVEALLSLEKLVEVYPESIYADDALVLIGDTYIAMNNRSRGIAAYDKVVTDYAAKTDQLNKVYLKLGLASFNAGDSKRALGYYESVLKTNPDAAESQEALTAIQEIYIDDMNDSKGYLKFLKGVKGQNITDFEKDSLTYRIAKIQFEKEKYSAAIPSYSDYLKEYEIGFFKLNAHYERAESYFNLSQYRESIEDYSFIVSKGRSEYYETSLLKMALIHYNDLQDFEEAFNYYYSLESETIDPKIKADAQIGALRSAVRINQHEAIRIFANKVKSNDQTTPNQEGFADFSLGKLYYNQKDFENADRHLQNASRLAEEVYKVEADYLLAEMTYRRGDRDKAEKMAEKALNSSSKYPYWLAKNMLLLSDVYIDRNELLDAKAALEAIIENFKKENEDIAQEAQLKLDILNTQIAKDRRILEVEKSDTLILDKPGGND